MKIVLPKPNERTARVARAERCHAEGCGAATREGKFFCTDHVEMHPYVTQIVNDLEQRDADDADAAKRHRTGRGKVNLLGMTARDLIMHLAVHGMRTRERLCRELNIDPATLNGYLEAMRAKRLVSFGHTKRGSDTVKLTRKGTLPCQ